MCNLSPYLKKTRNITDEEEQRILELIEIFKGKVRKWDDEEDEKFRRFLELQDPEFRAKLLECMNEHIQETNLIKSFFLRYRSSHIPQRPKSLPKEKATKTVDKQKDVKPSLPQEDKKKPLKKLTTIAEETSSVDKAQERPFEPKEETKDAEAKSEINEVQNKLEVKAQKQDQVKAPKVKKEVKIVTHESEPSRD